VFELCIQSVEGSHIIAKVFPFRDFHAHLYRTRSTMAMP
jgi:hypothetical protein